MSRKADRRGGFGDPERTEKILADAVFRQACRLAHIMNDERPPTRRQARKWGQRYGAAWARRGEALDMLAKQP